MMLTVGLVCTMLVITRGGEDTEEPEVQITYPVNGSVVSGTVNIAADATDNEGVELVEFYIDWSSYINLNIRAVHISMGDEFSY
jgi:hypothetical protein